MTSRIFAAAAFAAATVLSAGSAHAVYQTNSTSTGTSTVVAGTGANTINTISNGFRPNLSPRLFKSRSDLDSTNKYAVNGQRSGGGFSEGASGASAGDDDQRFGVWSNFTGSGFSESQSAIQTSGQVYSFVVGGDYRINDWVLGGLSVGYERQNINT